MISVHSLPGKKKERKEARKEGRKGGREEGRRREGNRALRRFHECGTGYSAEFFPYFSDLTLTEMLHLGLM